MACVFGMPSFTRDGNVEPGALQEARRLAAEDVGHALALLLRAQLGGTVACIGLGGVGLAIALDDGDDQPWKG